MALFLFIFSKSMNIKTSFKSVFIFLLSLTIIGCGGGSSIESTLNPVLINVIGLVDNDFSYSTQEISIESNYSNCEFRLTQNMNSPKILHLQTTNNKNFSFRNPIIYEESSDINIRIETIVGPDCPDKSSDLNFSIRKYPTKYQAIPKNTDDLTTRLFQINDIGFGGIVISDRFTATICYPTSEDCQTYTNELFGQDAHNMATGDFNGDGYEDVAVVWAVFPHTIEQKVDVPINTSVAVSCRLVKAAVPHSKISCRTSKATLRGATQRAIYAR